MVLLRLHSTGGGEGEAGRGVLRSRTWEVWSVAGKRYAQGAGTRLCPLSGSHASGEASPAL